MDLGVIDVGVDQRIKHTSGSSSFARCEESTLRPLWHGIFVRSWHRMTWPFPKRDCVCSLRRITLTVNNTSIFIFTRVSITNGHLIIHSNLILHRHLISDRQRHLTITNFHLSNENYIAHEQKKTYKNRT